MKNWLDKYDDGGTIPSFPVSANASLTHVDNPCGPGYVLTTDAQGNDICVNPASIQREGSDYGQQLREASQGTPTYVGSSWDVNRDGPYPSLKPSMPLETYSEVICPECSKQEKRNITKSLKRDKSINRDYNNTYDKFSNKKQSYYKHRTPNQGLGIGRFFNNLIERCLPGEDCFQFENGGPIKVTDPNDPRLKAYNDSLVVWKAVQLLNNNPNADDEIYNHPLVQEAYRVSDRTGIEPRPTGRSWPSIRNTEGYTEQYIRKPQPYVYDPNIPLMPKRKQYTFEEPVPLKTKVNQLGPPLSLNLFTDSGGSYMDQPQVAPKTDGTVYTDNELAKMGYRSGTPNQTKSKGTINKYGSGGTVNKYGNIDKNIPDIKSDNTNIVKFNPETLDIKPSQKPSYIKKHLYNAITSWSGDDFTPTEASKNIINSWNFRKPESDKSKFVDDVFLANYLEMSYDKNILEDSPYKPTVQKDNTTNYKRANQKFLNPQFIIDDLLKNNKESNSIHTGLTGGAFNPNYSVNWEDKNNLLNIEDTKNPKIVDPFRNVKLSKGSDKKGNYVSMYDIYDLASNPLEGIIGKPFEIYDRFYYDKKGKFINTETQLPMLPSFKSKGTINKYAYGGEVTSDSDENHISNSREFLKGWYNSPKYKEMLAASVSNKKNPIKEARLINEGRLYGLSVPVKTIPDLRKKQGAFGLNDITTNQIFLDKGFIKENPGLASSLVSHELSHNAYIPKSDIAKIKSFTPAYDPKIHHTSIMKNDPKENYNSLTDPEEVRAMIYGLRNLSKGNNIYDPFTEPATKEHLQQLAPLFQNTESGRSYDQLNRLKTYYTEEQIIDMMNTISENKNVNQNPPMAKDGGPIKYGTIDKSISGINRDATYVAPSSQQIDYSYNQNVPFGTSNPNVNPFYKKQAAEQFVSQGQSATIKNVDNSEQHKYQKVLNSVSTNNDLWNGILDFAKFPFQSGINLMNPQIRNDEDVLNTAIDVAGVLPIVGAATKFGIKTVNTGVDIAHNTRTAFNTLNEFKNAEKANELLNPQYLSIKEIPDKVRRIGNIWTNPTSNASEELIKYQRLRKANIIDDHLQSLTGLSKKDIDNKIIDISNSIKTAETINVDNLPGVPTLDDLTRLMQQNRNNTNPRLQNYINQNLDRMENEIIQSRGTIDLTRRPRRNNTEGQSNIGSDYPNIDTSFENSVLNSTTGILDRTRNFEYQDYLNQLNDNIISNLLRNTPTNTNDNFLNNFLNNKFNTKGINKQINNTILRKYILKSEGDVSTAKGSLYRNNSDVDAELAQIDNYVASAQSGDKIRGASSLSDSSFPLVVNKLKQHLLNKNLKGVEFEGYNSLNTSGYLNQAGIHPDIIIPYLNSHIKKLSEATGKKIPHAYYEENKGIMFPSLVGVKKEYGGVVKMADGGIVDYSLGSYVKDSGKLLLNTVASPLEQISGNNFVNFEYDNKGMADAAAVSEGVLGAATDVVGSYFLGPAYGMAKSTIQPMTSQIGHSTEYQKGANKWANQTGQIASSVGNLTSGIMSGNAQQIVGGSGQLLGTLGKEFDSKELAISGQVVGSASQFVGQGQSSGDSSSMTGAGDMVSSAGTQSAKHGGVVKLRKSSSVNWLDKYEDGSETKAQEGIPSVTTANQQAIQNAGTPYLNRAMVQAILTNASQPVTNTLGRVISTSASREQERREKFIEENPNKYSIEDYKRGIKEPGLENGILQDPIALAAALTAGGVGLGAYGLSQVPRMFARNVASEATMGLSDLTRAGLKGAAKQLGSSNALNLEELRSVYHNSERFLQPEEARFLHKKGYGLRENYRTSNSVWNNQQNLSDEQLNTLSDIVQHNDQLPPPPSEIQFMPDGTTRTIYNQQPITDYVSGSYRPDYIDLRRPINGHAPGTSEWNRLNNIITNQQIVPTPEGGLFGMTREQTEAAWGNIQNNPNWQQTWGTGNWNPNNPVHNTFDLNKLEKPINRSGLSKEQVIEKASSKDKDAISKMSDSEFKNTVLKPNGEIVPYYQGSLESQFSGSQNVTALSPKQYTDEFNSRLDLLNDIIAQRNKSDVNYQVKGLNESGKLIFYTPKQSITKKIETEDFKYLTNLERDNQRLLKEIEDAKLNPDKSIPNYYEITEYSNKRTIAENNKIIEDLKNKKLYKEVTQNIPEGESSWNVRLNPGKWRGNVEDIASTEYFRSIPGLEMSNTLSGVFPEGSGLKGTPGTKAYESINEYLKKLDLGRVKPGFNSQTETIKDANGEIIQTGSKDVWENFIKSGRGVGFYASPRTVYGTMKTVLGAGALGKFIADNKSNPEQTYGKGGSVNNNWLDKYN